MMMWLAGDFRGSIVAAMCGVTMAAHRRRRYPHAGAAASVSRGLDLGGEERRRVQVR